MRTLLLDRLSRKPYNDPVSQPHTFESLFFWSGNPVLNYKKITWVFFLSTFFLLSIGSRASEARTLSSGVRAFLMQARTAAERNDSNSLSRMTVAGVRNSYKWISSGMIMIAPQAKWSANILSLAYYNGKKRLSLLAFSHYCVCESAGDHIYRVISTQNGLRIGREIPETDTFGYRLFSHRFVVHFNMTKKQVNIVDDIHIKRTANSDNPIIIRLNEIWRISSVRHNGKKEPYVQKGGFLLLPPMRSPMGVYRIAYEGSPDITKEDYIRSNEAALTGFWYPQIARLPATADTVICVPKEWSAITQGALQGVKQTSAGELFHYKNHLPVCYLTIAAGKYYIKTRKYGGVRVSAWLLEKDSAKSEQVISTAYDMLQWCSKHLSPFPYPSYTVVESKTFPAALEGYSFTLVASSMLSMAIPHEVSHTWWGGILPNPYTVSMWNEAFAEYTDWLHRKLTGEPLLNDFTPLSLLFSLKWVANVPPLANAKDAMNPADSLVGYGEGLVMLQNLQRMIGARKMLEAMRLFLKCGKGGRIAEWGDFVNAVCKTSGAKWRGFFTSWLHGATVPSLSLVLFPPKRIHSAWTLSGEIAMNHGAFWMRTPFRVYGAGHAEDFSANIEGHNTMFNVRLPWKPDAVLLDPNDICFQQGINTTSPPSLVMFRALKGNLIWVYPSSVSEADRKILKEYLQSHATDFAPSAHNIILSDAQLNDNDWSHNNLLFIGPSEAFNQKWQDQCRFSIIDNDKTVKYDNLIWNGDDYFGFSISKDQKQPSLIRMQFDFSDLKELPYLIRILSVPSTDSVIIMKGRGDLIYQKNEETDIFKANPTALK
jgi:hypothetical protein